MSHEPRGCPECGGVVESQAARCRACAAPLAGNGGGPPRLPEPGPAPDQRPWFPPAEIWLLVAAGLAVAFVPLTLGIAIALADPCLPYDWLFAALGGALAVTLVAASVVGSLLQRRWPGRGWLPRGVGFLISLLAIGGGTVAAVAVFAPDTRTFGRQSSYVEGLAWSPDGRLLATVSRSGRVVLWNAERGAEEWVLQEDLIAEPHQSRTYYRAALAFSPDGEQLALAGGDEVLVWSVATRERLRQRDWPLPPRAVGWAPDGATLWVAAADREAFGIWRWGLEADESVRVVSGEGDAASFAFPQDARLAAVSREQGYVGAFEGPPLEIYDLENGELRQQLAGRGGHLAFTRDGMLLDVPLWISSWELWNLDVGRVVASADNAYLGHGAVISADGRFLATSLHRRNTPVEVTIQDPTAGTVLVQLKMRTYYPGWSAFSPDGRTLAMALVHPGGEYPSTRNASVLRLWRFR